MGIEERAQLVEYFFFQVWEESCMISAKFENDNEKAEAEIELRSVSVRCALW